MFDNYPPCRGCNGKGAWTWEQDSPYGQPGAKAADCPFCVGTGKELPYDLRKALRKALRKDKKAMLEAALAKKEAEAAALRQMLEDAR